MGVSSAQILKLYKNLLTEASKFPAYNFRMYFLRRIRDKFSENKQLTDKDKIEKHYEEGIRSLEVIKRQVILGNFFKSDELVIEKMRIKSSAT